MPRTLWVKLWRDLLAARGRAAMMAAAIAVSLVGLGAILSAYAVLGREVTRSYMETAPASMTLELDRVDRALLDGVRARPEVADAQARASVLARVRRGPDEWQPLLLFVVPDFGDMRVGRVFPEAGAWPPAAGEVLLERTAPAVIGARLGGEVVVRGPAGGEHTLRVSGLAHDPGLAPAWQERTGYGYITPATLALLGEPPALDELKVLLRGQPKDAAAVDAKAREIAAWAEAQGYRVRDVQVPPPGRHPHQGQMEALLLLLLVFSALSLGLSAILVATLVSGMLAQQVRQIGVLKAVGGGAGQVAALYLALVAVVAVAAWLLALPLGAAGGLALARTAAGLLNIDLASEALPWWVFAAQGAAGLLVPLLVALVPVLRGARVSVREAIGDYGVRAERLGRGVDRLLAGVRGADRVLLLALRNTFRRRGRLLLTLGLLAAGGALFLASLNVAVAWRQAIADGLDARHFDAEVRLGSPRPAEPTLALVRAVPGVVAAEAWSLAEAGPVRDQAFEIRRTYPDGGHGSFALRGMPAGSALVRLPLLAGRQLAEGDADGVVLNHMAAAQLPGVAVGDTVRIAAGGRASSWRVVGVVREVGSPAAAYVTEAAFGRAQGTEGQLSALRVVFDSRDPARRGALMRAVERALAEGGAPVSTVITDGDLRLAVDGHIVILVVVLLVLAALMAAVGVLGLAAALGASVAERTREFGVIQAVGGTPATVVRLVVAEGLAVGLMSWGLALAGALPITLGLGALLGQLAFRITLPLVYSPAAALLWLILVAAGSALASAVPARRAGRLTVREALTYA